MTTQETNTNSLDDSRWVEVLEEEVNAPSLQQLLDLKANAEQRQFDHFKQQCEQEDIFYEGTFHVSTAEGGVQIKTPKGHALIEDATNHVDVSNINIIVPPRGARGQANAEILTKFYIGAWNRARQEQPVLKMAVKHAFRYGLGVMKIMFDPDLWPRGDVPEEDDPKYVDAIKELFETRDVSFPYQVRTVNPKNIIWDTSTTDRKRWGIEKYMMPVEQVVALYGKEWEKTAANLNGEIEFWEYWDEEWVAYIADDRWAMRPRRHGYGRIPYVFADAGLGKDLISTNPSERYRGLLYYIHELLIEHARLLSQWDTLIRYNAWPTLDFVGPEEIVRRVTNQYSIEPGSKNWIDESVRREAFQPPQTPAEVQVMIDRIEAMIEEDTVPRVVRGMDAGATSGFDTSVRAGMARLKFGSIADGISMMIQSANELYARILENVIRHPIRVWAQTEVHQFDQRVKPDDIKGHYITIVRLEAASPEDQQNRAMLGMRLWNGGQGLISRSLAAKKYLGVQNPLEDDQQRMAEILLQQLLPQIAPIALDRIGLLPQLQQALGAGAQEGTPPPGGVGNMFLGGATSVAPRPDELQRTGQGQATRTGQPNQGFFPRSPQEIDRLGGLMGGAGGAPQPTMGGEQVT